MFRRISHYILLALSGGVIFLLLMEAVLRFLPVNSGLRMQPVSADRPFMLAYPKQSYTYSYGWALANAHHGRTNNVGIPNSSDWVTGQPAVLVVGDSYVESLMNDYIDTLQGRLEHALDPTPVYSMAHSGANAADYLHMMDYARHHLTLGVLIFRIDSNDFRESVLSKSGGESGHGWFDASSTTIRMGFKPYASSWIKETARNSALALYLQRNLKFNPVQAIRQELNASGKKVAEGNVLSIENNHSTKIESIIDYFLDQLPKRSGVTLADTVFIIDCDRKRIYGQLLIPEVPHAVRDVTLDYFIVRARALGANVLEMCPDMEAYVRLTGQRLDFSPVDYHWNTSGHTLVAETVIPRLQRILHQ